MKDNITLPELELPQLRQMVLENNRRTSKNETQINEMNRKISEQEQKDREREEWWEKARREEERARQAHNRDIQEIRELQKAFQRQLIEQSASNDLALKKSREEFDKRMKESDEQFNKQMRESQERHDRDMAEIKELHKEIDVKISRIDDKIAEIGDKIIQIDDKIIQIDDKIAEIGDKVSQIGDKVTQIGDKVTQIGDKITQIGDKITDMVVEIKGVTGHVVEGLISSTAEKMFQNAGFDLYNKGKEVKRKLTAKNLVMEVDVLLNNDETAIPIEVKTNCTKQNIDHFLKTMENFRTLFPEYDGHEIIAGIAAINYERDAYEYARQQGLLVICVNSDYIFSIAPFDKQNLKRF